MVHFVSMTMRKISVVIHAASLKVESLKYQKLKRCLQTHFEPLDDETLADTLEGITDLHEMIAVVIRSALVDEALRAGLRGRLDEMKERLSRLEVRSSKKRELALHAIVRRGLPSSSSQTLPPRPAQAPLPSSSCQQTIPNAYWLPQPPKLDRQGLLGELKRGAAIPGAELSNSKPVLMVRTK